MKIITVGQCEYCEESCTIESGKDREYLLQHEIRCKEYHDKEKKHKEEMGQVTISTLMKKLESFPDHMSIRAFIKRPIPHGYDNSVYDNKGIGSASAYRGYYDQLALCVNDDDSCTVASLKQLLKDSLSRTFYGYKGGEFVMNLDTYVWLATDYGDHSQLMVTDLLIEEDGKLYLNCKADC